MITELTREQQDFAEEMADWRKAEVHIEALMRLFIGNKNITDKQKDKVYEALGVVSDLRSEL